MDEQNWDAQLYNSKLRKLLPTLQGFLHGSKIVYVDAYKALMEIIEHPTKYGMFSINTRIMTNLLRLGYAKLIHLKLKNRLNALTR